MVTVKRENCAPGLMKAYQELVIVIASEVTSRGKEHLHHVGILSDNGDVQVIATFYEPYSALRYFIKLKPLNVEEGVVGDV